MLTWHSQWNLYIAKHYGCKQGWLRYHVFRLIQLLGRYQRFKHIDWNRVTRLVFVCKGNICRSPYGEIKTRALGISTSSFGLHAEGAMSAYPTALDVSCRRGLDLSEHRPRSMSDFTFLPGDLLITMEPWQAKQLQQRLAGDVQITLLGLWHSQPRPHIEDPYGLGEDYFETCFDIIDDAIQHVVLQTGISYAR